MAEGCSCRVLVQGKDRFQVEWENGQPAAAQIALA
jgi:hypothetical protein